MTVSFQFTAFRRASADGSPACRWGILLQVEHARDALLVYALDRSGVIAERNAEIATSLSGAPPESSDQWFRLRVDDIILSVNGISTAKEMMVEVKNTMVLRMQVLRLSRSTDSSALGGSERKRVRRDG